MLVEMLAAFLIAGCAAAADERPVIAVIIDDLGNQPVEDFAVASIEQLRSFAILPHTPHAKRLAGVLHQGGREVLVHLPMEAHDNNRLLGPGALLSSMDEATFRHTANAALESVPYAAAVNNHMGSLLTGDSLRMRWLMNLLSERRELLFVDSRTTPDTVAEQAARQAGVPYLARDVFLDNRRSRAAINARFNELIERALKRGDAIGIAHPYTETIAVLRLRVAQLQDVTIASLAEIRRRRQCRSADRSADAPGLVDLSLFNRP